MKYLFFLIVPLLICCNLKEVTVNKGKQIFVYEINYNNHYNTKFIKTLFVEDNEIYYMAIDSLKFYRKETHKAFLIMDEKIVLLINSINIAKLERIDYNNCSIIDSTKDRYVIEIRERGVFKHFSFPLISGCDPKSSSFLIEEIKNSFDRINERYSERGVVHSQ